MRDSAAPVGVSHTQVSLRRTRSAEVLCEGSKITRASLCKGMRVRYLVSREREVVQTSDGEEISGAGDTQSKAHGSLLGN